MPSVPEFRDELGLLAAKEGADVVYRKLVEVDPVAAEKVDPRNVRRVIRALEIRLVSGGEEPDNTKKSSSRFPYFVIGLTASRPTVYKMADSKTDSMIEAGLVDEVKQLLGMGYSLSLPSMSSIGYREIQESIQGDCSLVDAVGRMKFHTHRYIRHQYSWFRVADQRINWHEIGDTNLRDVTAKVLGNGYDLVTSP